METIHEEAARFGIETPTLERHTYTDSNNVIVNELTDESNQAWSNYLRDVTLAKIAFKQK